MNRFIILIVLFSASAILSQNLEVRCGSDGLQNGFTETLDRPTLSGPELIIESNNFVVHYTTSGDDATNYGYAYSISTAAEHSLSIITGSNAGQLGWKAPPPDDMRGGNNKYDIYIMEYSAEGVTIREIPVGWSNQWAASYIIINNELVNEEQIKVVTAHELAHACQFAYSYVEIENNGLWFYENCAVWIEKKVYPEIISPEISYLQFLVTTNENPIKNPKFNIDYARNKDYTYAGFLWPLFLSEWQSDDDIVRLIWERLEQNTASTIIPDIDYVLINSYNTDINSAFIEYATWRWFTGTRATPGNYFSISGLISLEATPVSIIQTYPYQSYTHQIYGNGGCNYFLFQGYPEIININFNGPGSPNVFKVNTLRDLSPDEPSESQQISLANNVGSLDIQRSDCNGVVLIPIKITPSSFSDFTFSAAQNSNKRVVRFENRYGIENLGGHLLLDNTSPAIPSGNTKILSTSTVDPYTVKTLNERFSAPIVKQNNWNNQPSFYFLGRNFPVTPTGDVNQFAHFREMKNATIRNVIDDISFNDQLPVWFNDPWYVKDQYNNQSGMGDFISFQSPYYPTGKYNESTGGVFLNQGWPSWQPPYYSVKVPQTVQDIYLPQTGKYHKFYFQGWSGTEVQFQNNSSLQTGVVFKDDIQGVDPVVNANLKGTQLSGNTNGFSNSSQRKFIATLYPQYYYHLVYSSGGSVWYEKALINSEVVQPLNWQLMNNAKPLNGDFFYTEAKSPSIDYCYATHGGTEENYFIYIVYQKKKADNKYEIRLSKFNQSGVKIFDIQVFSSAHTDYSTFDCMPVVGVSRQKDDLAPIKVVVLWRRPAEGSATAGLYYVAGFDQGTSINWTDNYPTGYKISTTDINSINPSLAVFKSPFANISYHLAYQQGTSQIKYTDIIFGVNGTSAETPIVISTGSGSSTNITPSITVHNTRFTWPVHERVYDSPKVVWCTGYEGCGVYRTKPNKSAAWSPFYIYLENDDVQSPTISGPKYHPSGMDDIFHFGWSWLAGYYKSYVSTSNLALKRSLPYSGTNIQIANNMMEWDGFGYCVLSNFSGTSAPFTFQNKWVEDGLNKPGNNIQAGRAGTIIKDEAEFYFALGDIRLNDSEIDFVTVSDTLAIINLNDLNSSLVTESFEVNDNTLLNYSIFYGFNDSLLAYNSLSEPDQIDFKVEIIDDLTLQVLGVHHNIAQLKQDLKVLENTSYQVNMQGIGNRSIRLRLTAGNNFTSVYSLSNIYSFNQNLGKENINLLKWDGSDVITEYALEQNYPNPFNPSTTIRYQLPQDGMVTLKVYDILGSEAVTLVNEQKSAGRYEVNFDASRLASGVYIYKITSGSYVSSKKMLLVK